MPECSSTADRPVGLSVRLKLALSYAAVVVGVGSLLLGTVWLFLLRYVPDRALLIDATEDRLADGVFPVRSQLLRVFAPRAAAVLAVLLVIGLVGGWILAGRMLAPLARITDATRIAGTGSLGHRINLAGRRDEFRDLADAFDAMLARLEAHNAQQQRFAANASHELRTPLTITQTLLDVAMSAQARPTPELLDQLRSLNTRAIDTTQALLLLSRVEQDRFPRSSVDVALVADEAIETMLPIAERHHVTIDAVTETAMTLGSAPLLLQLATNLVHNAVVHNLANDGTVRVETATQADHVSLTVENTGPHVTEAVITTLTEPFVRGDERIASDRPGVGLKLPPDSGVLIGRILYGKAVEV